MPPRPSPAPAATLPAPEPRPRTVYAKPPQGASNLLLWTFAAVGFLAVAGGGVWAWKSRAPAPEAANKPVVWRSVARGDEVLVTVEILPRNTTVTRLLLDGDPAPSNPLLLARGTIHQIIAVADGFAPAGAQVVADRPKTVHLKLEPAR